MSPFQSKSQQRYMFAKQPTIAKRWANNYMTPKNLPERKSKLKKQMIAVKSQMKS